MKMDHELIKKILLGFEKASTPYASLKKVAEIENLEIDDNFIYNCDLIADRRLIVDSNGISKTGIKKDLGGDFSMAVIGLRLSAEGHEYLSAIKKPAIWEKTKKIAGDAGLGTMIEVAKIALGEAIKNAFTG